MAISSCLCDFYGFSQNMQIPFGSILRCPFSWTIWSRTLLIGSSCSPSTLRDAPSQHLSMISTSRVWPSTQVRRRLRRAKRPPINGFISYSAGATLNQVEIELSPILAGLAVTAASLFVFVCCVLMALYRRQRNAEK